MCQDWNIDQEAELSDKSNNQDDDKLMYVNHGEK